MKNNNNLRKLLLHDKVQVRQLEEGLRGSWHSGVVVGVSDSCRDVRYNELLCESGKFKLVESIPVTGAIEGLYQRHCVKYNHRGRIRPVPQHTEPCSSNSGLKFGACVDVFFKEAWWEGVIFDCYEDAKERRVFFPDEGDVRIYKLSDIRVTFEWDEFSGDWRERGTWLLVNLVGEHKKDGNLFQLVMRVWSHLKVHYGYQKMISEWTCGAYYVWKEYFREVICEIATKPRVKGLVFPSTSHRHEVKKRSRWCKRGSYLNGSVLTRSMQGRKDREVNLAVRTRRMCMSEPENSPISAATKGSHLADSRCRHNHSVDGNCCIISESPRVNARGEINQVASVSDRVKGEKESCYGRTTQSRRCYETHSKMLVRNRFRRKWYFVGNCLTPRKLKPSKLNRHKLGTHTCDSSRMKRQEGDHIALQVLDYESVAGRKALMRRQTKIIFTMGYYALRKGVRKRIPRQNIRKKKNRLRIQKVSLRMSQVADNKSKPTLLDEFEASKSSQKGDVLGSRCESSLPVADPCQELGSEDGLINPDKHRARRNRFCDSVCFICQYGDELLHCDHCLSSYHLSCVDLEEATIGGLFCPSCRCGLFGLKDCDSNDKLFSDVCYQCSRQYHLACLRRAGISVSEDIRFCSKSCFEVSQVLNVFHECFQPITEPHTGNDLVTDIVYNSGSKLRRLDFHGFYVMALVDGDELVCAATIRIHGQKVAEMPLIATPFKYRRKGMCRLLLHELEKMLIELGVERLVLPGIATLSETWVSSFGFMEMPASVRRELLGYPFVVFQGTTMFEKILSRSPEEASECSMSSPNKCAMKQLDKTERASRPITRAYSRRNGWNSSLQESMKLDRAQLGHSQENGSKNECRKFSLCHKRRNLEAFNEEKAVVGGSDKNQPTFKCIRKRRRIQASRDSVDCL
ncbi:hypothetical protein KSS87_013121 [Heliosperma pusillum]|nr:hypothetical protein KSS87_013121 [Heliosperma pusillum]